MAAGPSPSPGPITHVACQAPPAFGHHVAPAQSPRDCPKIRRTSRSPPRPRRCDPVSEKTGTQWVLPDLALAESTLLKGETAKAHSSEDSGPSQLRGLLSGGWTPGRQRNPDPLQKTTGLALPLNTGTRLAGSLDPAKPRKPARLADPARYVDSVSTTSARQLNPARPKPPQQASATHGVLSNPAAGQLPSHPGRMMGTRLQSTMTEATVPRPCLWSAGTWQQCPSPTR